MTPKGNNAYGAFSEPELYMGFIRGYRGWSMTSLVEDVNGTCGPGLCWPRCGKREHMAPLRSVFISKYAYEPGINVAQCAHDQSMTVNLHPLPPDHAAPTADCTCGFYATHYGFPGEYLNRVALGTVKASGRILLGDIGFRSEKIEIESLAVGYDVEPFERPRYFKALKVLGEHYNVPVFEHPAELLKAFPPTEVEGLLVPPTRGDFQDWPVAAGFVTNQGVVELRRSPAGTIPLRAVLINQDTGAVLTQIPTSFGFTLTDGEHMWLIRWMTFAYCTDTSARLFESSTFATPLDVTLDEARINGVSASWQRAWDVLDDEIRVHLQHRGRELKAGSATYLTTNGLQL